MCSMLCFKKYLLYPFQKYGEVSRLAAEDANHYSYVMWNKHKKENAKCIIKVMFDT